MTPEDFKRFCDDYDVAIAVMSRDRAAVLQKHTDRLFGNYTLFWSGDGYAEREYHCVERVEVPRGLEGRPTVANYAVRHFEHHVVILLDDDIRYIDWLGEDHLFKLDADAVRVMLCNLVVNALDLKVGLFGINECDIRKSSPLIPFHTRAMVQSLVGIVGPQRLWHDERQRIKADYDLCLQALKRDRLIWKDLRYFLNHNLNTLPGGNMPFRTPDREEVEVENLRKWWGDDVISWHPDASRKVGRAKGSKSLRINV